MFEAQRTVLALTAGALALTLQGAGIIFIARHIDPYTLRLLFVGGALSFTLVSSVLVGAQTYGRD